MCESGFHFCEHPSGVWTYYSEGRVFKCEAEIVIKSTTPGANRKHVARRIRLTEEIEVTGNRNTGDWNTGNKNTGDWNTGYRNTGDGNTGYRNTGHGNCGNCHSGCLNHGEAPFYLFDLPARREDTDMSLVRDLANLLAFDDTIDPEPFLGLPNATPERIKELHEAHKNARGACCMGE